MTQNEITVWLHRQEAMRATRVRAAGANAVMYWRTREGEMNSHNLVAAAQAARELQIIVETHGEPA